MTKLLLACAEIAQEIIELHKENKKINVSKIMRETSQRYKLSVIPRVCDVISCIPNEYQSLIQQLRVKPVRTASGVAIVAVMCKPHRCPHIALTGNICVYCPGGPDSSFEYSTQSYTGYEPTSMRAIRARYDPFEQSRERIKQLRNLGHSVDKVEYIIMGGTFMSLSETYRDNFVMNLHDALSGHRSSTLDEAIRVSAASRNKCIGITIETRPDYCMRPHINKMLSYGCTRIEIGVQSVYEDVAIDTNRGHSVESVCDCFSIAKDAGFKIVAHMMPNLPNVDKRRDFAQFYEYFDNPKFRSDGLKIYPTLVIRDTGLYELWKNGKYRSYSPDELIDFISRILCYIPPWTRVYRVQRDIPMTLVSSGVEHGNIRELALARMKEYNGKCRDVRTREVGIKEIHDKTTPEVVELVRRDYAANDGWETFLSYEDMKQDILIGLLRLRKCSKNTYRPELKDVQNLFALDELNDNAINKNTINKNTINNDNGNNMDKNAINKNAINNDNANNMDKNTINNDNGNNMDKNASNKNTSNIDSINNGSSKSTNNMDKNTNNMNKNTNNMDKNTSNMDKNTSNMDKNTNNMDINNNYTKDDKFTPENKSISKNLSSTYDISNDDIDVYYHPAIFNNNASIIRELHVYGSAVEVDHKDTSKFQHRGFGKLLIREAERIAREEHRSSKIVVISGVGTRNYYSKFGYTLEGPYMVKNL